MKKKIQEVHDYFRNKIAAGKYEVKEVDEYTIRIIVDKIYTFNIWIANGRDYIIMYDGKENYMEVQFEKIDQNAIWKRIQKIKSKHYEDVVKVQKLKQFESLKKELGIKCEG